MLIATLVVGLSTSHSFASVITYAGYSHDTTTDLVNGAGLEWLQWDVTANQSIATALGTYAGSGWRLASNLEMSTLFNSFSFGIVFDSDENTRQTQQISYLDQNSENEVTNIFISMFGDTHKASGGTLFGTIDEPFEITGAYFGEDGNGNNLYNFAAVSDDYVSDGVFGLIRNFAFATLAEDGSDDTAAYLDFGVALVRDVPNPGTLMLILLGLAIGARTRLGIKCASCCR